MASKQMKRSRSEWSVIIERLEGSGASVAAFARQHGLNARTLAWWRWKLSDQPATPSECAPGFFPVLVSEPATSPPRPQRSLHVSLMFANGTTMRFDEAMDVEDIAELALRLGGAA